MAGQCSGSIDKEVEDLLNQGLNRRQIVSKLQSHDKRKVYQSIARVLSLDASDAQLAYELSLFRICSFFLLLVVDDLKNHDPEGVYVMESNPVITRVIVIPSTSKRMYEANGNGIVSVDGCFMAGEGTILAAVLRDGNGKIQLLGYQLCHGETKENWTAFLQALRDGAGLTRETLFFADRPPYLLNCFRSVFGEDFQYFGCLQHLVRDATNWCRSAGLSLAETKHMKALIKHAAYAPTEEDHQAFMDQIRKGCPRVYRHLNSVETLWAGIQSTDRFGYMTSNNIESFNALIKRDVGTVIPIRSMRVFRAAIALYNLYCKQILEREEDLLAYLQKKEDKVCITQYAESIVNENMNELKKKEYKVHPNHSCVAMYGRQWKLYTVDFKKKTCSCGYYQDLRIPCIHACALLKHIGRDKPKYYKSLVDPHYYSSTVLETTMAKPYMGDMLPDVSYDEDVRGIVMEGPEEGSDEDGQSSGSLAGNFIKQLRRSAQLNACTERRSIEITAEDVESLCLDGISRTTSRHAKARWKSGAELMEKRVELEKKMAEGRREEKTAEGRREEGKGKRGRKREGGKREGGRRKKQRRNEKDDPDFTL